MIGVFLAILSAATSAISVVLVRKHSDLSNTFNISLIISLVGLVVLWPLALVSTDFSVVNVLALVVFGVSGVFSPGLVRLLYYQGMKKLGAPVNSSLFSTYPLYTSLLAIVFLSEVLSLGNWFGILLVFLGGVMIEWSAREINVQNKRSRINLLFPVVGGVLLGVSSILRKYGLVLYNAPFFGVAVAYSFSLLPFVFMLTSSSVRSGFAFKRDVRLFWAAGIGQAITWILAFYALSFENVSIVTPLLSIEPVFVAVFAYMYLRKIEQLTHKLLISIALTFLGVILVTARLF
jgi:drug/metabolite transporter, DME family